MELNPALKLYMPIPYHPTQRDGRAVAEDNEVRVLRAVRHFGHLRRQEIAMAAWPKSSAKSAYIMAWRTVTRLLKAGLLLERQNSLGGRSLVLGARGVARLRDLDIQAHEGYELAFDGPQFFHRTLGTAYLLEKARTGNEVFGEYAILRGWSPLSREYTSERFRKIPDGLVVYSGEAMGLRKDMRVADWVEVESAFKQYDEIKKALAILTKNSTLTQSGDVTLNQLVFVFDSRQRHDRQILRYVKKFLKENPGLSEEIVMRNIILARCFVDVPFTWHGVQEVTAWDVVSSGAVAVEDLDSVPDDDIAG